METHQIDYPTDRRYPFPRTFLEDRLILYHGAWSKWEALIERDGFVHGRLPFDWRNVSAVFDANRAIGRGSMLAMFLGEYPRKTPSFGLYLTSNFWLARAYSTNGGGEVIEQTLKEAEQFERIYESVGARIELQEHWKRGLLEREHAPTRAALNVLMSDSIMKDWYDRVRRATEELQSVVADGYPVVYAVRTESSWFGDRWETYIDNYENGLCHTDLRCPGVDLTPDRIVGKVSFPNGTESDYQLGCFNWDDATAIQ